MSSVIRVFIGNVLKQVHIATVMMILKVNTAVQEHQMLQKESLFSLLHRDTFVLLDSLHSIQSAGKFNFSTFYSTCLFIPAIYLRSYKAIHVASIK